MLLNPSGQQVIDLVQSWMSSTSSIVQYSISIFMLQGGSPLI